MASPLLLNMRVFPDKTTKGNPAFFLTLTHFGTDSGIQFRCEFYKEGSENSPSEVWGVSPYQIRGSAFSYFGQFIGEAAQKGEAFSCSDANMQTLAPFDRDRISALTESVITLLDFLFQSDDSRADYIAPQEIVDVLHNQVYTLCPQQSPSGQTNIVLHPMFMTQKELSIGLAKMNDVFNKKVPKFHLEDGVTGVYEDLIAEVEPEKIKAH